MEGMTDPAPPARVFKALGAPPGGGARLFSYARAHVRALNPAGARRRARSIGSRRSPSVRPPPPPLSLPVSLYRTTLRTARATGTDGSLQCGTGTHYDEKEVSFRRYGALIGSAVRRCAHARTHTHMHAHTHAARTHTHARTRTHSHACTRPHTHSHALRHAHKHTNTHTDTHAHARTRSRTRTHRRAQPAV